MVFWQWKTFEELSTLDLYGLLALRQEVFSCEQNCAYLDADGKDFASYHLLGWEDERQNRLSAYLRVVFPGHRFNEYSIGRVVIHSKIRGKGMGKLLVQEGITRLSQTVGSVPIRISAQAHLEGFYQSFGFITQGEPYAEDSIPHLEMLRPAYPSRKANA